MAFTILIYKETVRWSSEEKFGLVSQIRRATSSTPLNIAEGSGNTSNKEFSHCFEQALRSAYQVMTAIDIARGLDFLTTQRADELLKELDEIVAMLVGLMKSLGWKTKIQK